MDQSLHEADAPRTSKSMIGKMVDNILKDSDEVYGEDDELSGEEQEV